MKKFKIGDKVRLRNNLEVGEDYGGIIFVSGMEDSKGMELTIDDITSLGNYTVKESGYFYSEEMLEKVTDNNDNLFEYALEKLNMTKDELEEEYEKNKTEKQVIEHMKKRYRDFENYCDGRCCDDCDVEKFLKRNNMKEVSAGNCILIYEHLFNKEGE